MRRPSTTILLAMAGLFLVSCAKPPPDSTPRFLTQHIGEGCTVQFRRDALGASASMPIGPDVSSTNGNTVILDGKLLAVEPAGIAIDSTLPPAVYWIPYHAVLSVGFARGK